MLPSPTAPLPIPSASPTLPVPSPSPTFPIPSPSPTVERIVVEVTNSSAGAPNPFLTGIISGLIAAAVALLAARWTHGYTERRESGGWLRERLFDVSKVLVEQQRLIQSELLKPVNIPEVKGNMVPSTYQQHLDLHDWRWLYQAVVAYDAALDQATLLLRTSKLQPDLEKLRADLHELDRTTRKFDPPGVGFFDPVPRSMFDTRNKTANERFASAHNAFLTAIAKGYFLRGKQDDETADEATEAASSAATPTQQTPSGD